MFSVLLEHSSIGEEHSRKLLMHTLQEWEGVQKEQPLGRIHPRLKHRRVPQRKKKYKKTLIKHFSSLPEKSDGFYCKEGSSHRH